MGVSTDGQLCFGVKFEEGFKFPWDAKPFAGDIEAWWMALRGYKPIFEMYDERGEYKDGKEPSKAQQAAYYDHKAKFKDVNPLPVVLVNYCSYDCPMYIIAITSSSKQNSRGFPEIIDPTKLIVTDEEIRGLKDFIVTHVDLAAAKEDNEEFDPEPKWYLSSLWG